MFGIDISNHQNGIDLSKFYFDFAIVKATEGRNFKDRSFESHIAQLTKLDKLIGVYHYLRPDNQNSEMAMKMEAANFVASIDKANLIGKALLFADWEQQPTDRIDLLQMFLEYVEKYTEVVPFVYSSRSWFNEIGWQGLNFKNPLWVAWWPSIAQIDGLPTEIPFNVDTVPGTIWQFTSNGKVNGYKGRVDFDYTNLTKEEWLRLAHGAPVEYISDDMDWAIKNDLFHGFTDGTYRPNDMLTRGQCATVLRRFYNNLVSGSGLANVKFNERRDE